MVMVVKRIGVCFFLLAWIATSGSASAGVWQDLNGQADTASRGLQAKASYYRALKADEPMLRQALAVAPLERTASQGAIFELPMPNGESQQFEVMLSPIMAPALAARYPEIKTYSVTGIDNPAINGRLDMSPLGFHAMLSTPSGTVYIDPDAEGNYRSYYKQDYSAIFHDHGSQHVCHMAELDQTAGAAPQEPLLAQRSLSTNTRRIYRLAVVTTGEYGSYFGSESLAASSVITTINRVNQIYGRDLAVQLQLTEVIVYAHPSSDPFSDPNDLIAMLSKNQEILDYAVGLDNYDIGHLFGRSGGGLALLGAACTDNRAQGYTGHPTPDVGDTFDIDFVAHEIGHQLDATHSFNGTTDNCGGDNRSAGTAVEPGSGTTIMAYAGICGGEDLQSNSDATFHAVNIQQINTFITSGDGRTCGTLNSIGNGLPTTIDAGTAVTDLPAGTPFVLTGSASADPNGDTLSYQWDQIDANGTATTDPAGANPVDSDLGDNPLFRSFLPKSTPTRYFPRLSTLIAGGTDIGETLPTTSRTMHFRMTVRDGNSGVGDDDVSVTVNASQGPFQIDGGALNSATSLAGGTAQTLVWNVNGTDTSCPNVTATLLSISADGSTYCDKDDDATLGPVSWSGILNNGNATLTLPIAQIARARVMLSCDDNVFFALSDTDFALNSASNPIASNCKTMDGEPLEHGTVFVSPNLGTGDGVSTGGGGGALFILPLMLGLAGLLRRFA